jgi:hypothetical protein
VTVRQGKRCKQLLGDFKETRGYCKLKEEAAGDTVGFRCSLTEFFRLLGDYLALVGLELTFRDYTSVPSSMETVICQKTE